MWPDAYSKPADSDPDYTLDSEEPVVAGTDIELQPSIGEHIDCGRLPGEEGGCRKLLLYTRLPTLRVVVALARATWAGRREPRLLEVIGHHEAVVAEVLNPARSLGVPQATNRNEPVTSTPRRRDAERRAKRGSYRYPSGAMPTSDALLTFGCAARREPGIRGAYRPASVPTNCRRCSLDDRAGRQIGGWAPRLYSSRDDGAAMARPRPPPAGVAADGVVTVDASGQKSLPVVYSPPCRSALTARWPHKTQVNRVPSSRTPANTRAWKWSQLLRPDCRRASGEELGVAATAAVAARSVPDSAREPVANCPPAGEPTGCRCCVGLLGVVMDTRCAGLAERCDGNRLPLGRLARASSRDSRLMRFRQRFPDRSRQLLGVRLRLMSWTD